MSAATANTEENSGDIIAATFSLDNGNTMDSEKKEEEMGLWYCRGRRRKCKKCLKERANEVRRSSKQPLEMKLEDFIELGEAYYWFLDMIDPFTGMLPGVCMKQYIDSSFLRSSF